MLSPTASIVQRCDPERFVTCLFAPAEHREGLFALYAFNHELARAREVASQPMLALIRLQWWREVVQGRARRHEVATPLLAALQGGVLDPSALLRMIAARELEADDALTPTDLAIYLRDTSGALMAEAGRLLGASETQALAEHGAACGAVGLLRNAAILQAQGRWQDLDPTALRRIAAQTPRRWSTAALPAALPAVLARRWLSRPTRPPLGTGGRLAVWAASVTRCC